MIWFALGAGTAGLVSVMAMFLTKPLVFDDTVVPYLVLTEPDIVVTPTSVPSDEGIIAFKTGQILRGCGARGFETTALYPDHSPTAELPLIPENNRTIECVMKAIRDQDLAFKVEFRWSSPVANEMRMKR